MKVCIDPGHGGSDPGGEFRGVREKDIVLDIALRLDGMLRPSRQIETFLTRRSDTFPTLSERVALANSVGADYFVSIHTNADPDPDRPGMPEAEGAEIWVAERGQGRRVAAPIAAAIGLEFPDEPWRGIRERDLYVLAKTRMPACLVEVAFIDHSESNRELRDPAVREEIAFTLMRGILDL